MGTRISNAGSRVIVRGPPVLALMALILCVLSFSSLVCAQSQGLADLELSGMQLSTANVEEARVLLASVNIANLGGTDAKNIWVYFYLGLDDSGPAFARSRVASLSPGESERITAFWNATEREYEVYVLADPNGFIDESDETNNDAVSDIVLSAGAGPGTAEPSAGAGPDSGSGDAGLDLGILGVLFFLVLAVVILVLVFLPLLTRKAKRGYYVLPESIYKKSKQQKTLYDVRNRVIDELQHIYTTANCTEPFMSHIAVGKNDLKLAETIRDKYGLSQDYAEAVALAKRLKATLLISSKQIWVAKVGDDMGLSTKTVL